MTKSNILLRNRTSGWVSIHNNGNGKAVAVQHFLQANGRHMTEVCFGDTGTPNTGSWAIKAERVPAFIAYAAKFDLVAEVGA